MARKPEKDAVAQPAQGERDSFGLLVGWAHHAQSDKIDLKLQTVANSSALSREQIDNHHIVMTKQQATVLANYLFTITNQTPPRRRGGRLARWFGV